MNKDLAPICLFTYNRLSETRKTVEALQNNFLAKESDLIIFSDGPQNEGSLVKIQEVRDYIQSIEGFNSVKVYKSSINKGLGDSIIAGVTKVVNEFGSAIVLEDDLITTPNFLDYMNQALDFYHKNSKIISICGYGLKIKRPKNYNSDFYLYGRSSSWGWGTWKEEWNSVDWQVKDWKEFSSNKEAIKAFNYNGSDMFKMLKSVTEGNGSSWAIRFGYSQFKQNKYSLMPFESFVKNNGFGVGGTNTKFKFSRFKTRMNSGQNRNFIFDDDIQVNRKIEKECYKYHSFLIRIYSRIRYITG
ncbi:glycosyltransferase [Zunongwangia atlantica]|uniref:Glycosyltransferase n=1 Tax=Zunongwangia atlantica 22II14-10F7 TaxID=1185767 RepID=A0A1Y1SY92_9FLAO|nr:glycosyltransferase [Zunongwangia atlantica]ORL43728.1 glycosyltransferase [Zunongwangia atlantica 22II14-10F7]